MLVIKEVSGNVDCYCLHYADYGVEDYLKCADFPAVAVVEYGDRQGQCWILDTRWRGADDYNWRY